MTQLTIILFLVVVGFIALFAWNAANFRSLQKQSKLKETQLNDAKYWELKYKFEFLVAVVGIITAVVGLLGYNSLRSIENSVKEDFSKKVDSVQKRLEATVLEANDKLNSARDSVQLLKSDIKVFQRDLNENAKNLNALNRQQELLQNLGLKSQHSLKDLAIQIDNINARNKERKEFYLVSGVPITPVKDKEITVKFSDLRTVSGDLLPVFKKPPIVMAAFARNIDCQLFYITEDDFQINIIDNSIVKVEDYFTKTYSASFIIYDVN